MPEAVGQTVDGGAASPSGSGQEAAVRRAVLIGGLGGTPEHTERFERFLAASRRALVEQYGFDAAMVTVLAENALAERPFVNAVSTAENITSTLENLSSQTGVNDDVYVILFGHGSYDGTHAKLNIPRRDLDDVDYDRLLANIAAKRIVVINTASSSGPFVAALSAPGRVVITATRSGTERNETRFATYFVEALGSGVSDLDRNGELSVAEVFRYASEQARRSYDEDNNLATEHALLDDNGDGAGTEFDELAAGGDGALAAATLLTDRSGSLASLDPAQRGAVSDLLVRRERLEIDIAELKSTKQTLSIDDYYSQLEALFVSLARLNDNIESQGQ